MANNNKSAMSKFPTKHAYWHAELTAAKKNLKTFHERSKYIVNRFNDERDESSKNKMRFNLFSTNVDILQAALFARVPEPDVSRRYRDSEDQIGRVAALILQRGLTYELETDDYFETLSKNIIQDFLITGLGTAWVRYDVEQEASPYDDMMLTDSAEQASEQEATLESDPVITDEQTPVDYVHWQDFLYPKARTWDEVRWVARRTYMNEHALAERFGDEKAAKITFRTEKNEDSDPNRSPDETRLESQAEVYEIWDKNTKKVYWFSFYGNELLDEKDDPLGLPGFFPTKKPLIANPETSSFLPRPDYDRTRGQYEELDNINSRISLLISALAVKGVYNAASEGIKGLLSNTVENKLIPVEKWDSFADKGGVGGQIEMMPLLEVQQTLAGLNAARDNIKAQIYEMTGISDIVRGVGQMYATATAEQLKSQYASLRLTQKQQAVAEYMSGMVQLKAHLMCKFYEPQRLLERAGKLSAADQPYVQEAIALLKSEGLQHFRLKVSVDSLQLPDWNAEKSARTELLMGVSQFLGQALPAAKENPTLAPLMSKLLLFSVSGYKGADVIEGEIQDGLRKLAEEAQQKAQNPTPPPPTDAQIKAQLEEKRMQMEDAHAKGKAQQESAEAAAQREFSTKQAMGEAQYKAAKLEYDKQVHADEMDIERRKLAIEEQKVQLEKVSTLIAAKQAYQQINAEGMMAPGAGTGSAYDESITQQMDQMGADLSNTSLVTKEELAAQMQQMMQVFQQGLQAIMDAPMPEQTITVQRTPDGLVGKIH